MTAFSVLDLSPIVEGGDARRALLETTAFARAADRLGFKRFWVAEHHNMPGIASAATSVVIGHVAAATSTIRVGAGGIMLPNHSPLVIAEQFGTLETLFPGRIDLGLGRAPGTDMATARALRRHMNMDVDSFPHDVVELMSYLSDEGAVGRVQAIPGHGTNVPLWILGSSLYGAQLAAALGLPYAFASHFAPAELDRALEIYRAQFKPSVHLDRPYAMPGISIVAADTDEEARYLFSSTQQAFVNLRSGRPGPLPRPMEGYAEELEPTAQAILAHTLACAVVGSPDTVRQGIADFQARTGADEIIVTAQIHDHEARRRSLEILAEVAGLKTMTRAAE